MCVLLGNKNPDFWIGVIFYMRIFYVMIMNMPRMDLISLPIVSCPSHCFFMVSRRFNSSRKEKIDKVPGMFFFFYAKSYDWALHLLSIQFSSMLTHCQGIGKLEIGKSRS